jgi:hypothetical protein
LGGYPTKTNSGPAGTYESSAQTVYFRHAAAKGSRRRKCVSLLLDVECGVADSQVAAYVANRWVFECFDHLVH